MKLFSVKHILSLALIAGLCTPSTHGWLLLPRWSTVISLLTPGRSISWSIALSHGFDDRLRECAYGAPDNYRTQATLVNATMGLMFDRLCSGQITQPLSGREVVKEYAMLVVLNYLVYCAGKYVPMAYRIWRKKPKDDDLPPLSDYLRYVFWLKPTSQQIREGRHTQTNRFLFSTYRNNENSTPYNEQ